jgi:hypothetical protein
LQRLLERFCLGAGSDIQPLNLLAVCTDKARLKDFVPRRGKRGC